MRDARQALLDEETIVSMLRPAEQASGRTVKQRPSVTVVVPTRNRRRLLERAVTSILSQRYEGEIECLLVFDQSDPFLPSIDVPTGSTVRAIVNARAPGPAGARNTGALAAAGDVLAFCDDDDEWLGDKLRLQVEALSSNPEALAVSCGLYVFYKNGGAKRLIRNGPVTLPDLLRSRVMQINMSTLVVRRKDFVSRVGLFDEEIPGSYGEDFEWLLRVTQHGPVAMVPSPLARIHWREGPRSAESWRTIILALEYLLRRHPELQQNPKGLSRIYGQIALAHAALHHPGEARRWARRCLSLYSLQPRAYIALFVSLGLARAETVVHLAHKVGRGLV